MGFLKSLGRIGRNIWKGLGKVTRAISFGMILHKGVGRALKKVWKSKIGKALIIAAAIYTGGVALGFLAAPSALAGGLVTPAGAAFAQSSPILAHALEGAALGSISGAATGGNKGAVKGALIGGVTGGAVGAYGKYASDAATAATQPASAAPTAAVQTVPGETVASTTGAPAPWAAGGATDIAQGVTPDATSVVTGAGSGGSVVTGAGGGGGGVLSSLGKFASKHPMLTFGAVNAAGSALSGYGQMKGQEYMANIDARQKELDRQFQQQKYNASQFGQSGQVIGVNANIGGANPADYWDAINRQNVAAGVAPSPVVNGGGLLTQPLITV